MSEQDHIGGPHGGHRYNPNQPRVPAGQATGGRWTSVGGHDAGGDPGRKFVRDATGEEPWNFFFNTFRPDGSLAEQVVVNRDRSRIVSEFSGPGGAEDWDERHIVILPDGSKFTFENSGDTQTIYDADGQPISRSEWTSDGPEFQPTAELARYRVPRGTPPPVVDPRGAPPRDAQSGSQLREAFNALVAAGTALFTWLSSRNGPDGTAVFAFRADDYLTKQTPSGQVAVRVGRLTEEQVNASCPRLNDVQAETNKAAGAVNRADYATPAAYGTAVHLELHKQIKAGIYPDLSSEISILKTLQETGKLPSKPQDEETKYGTKGSIRIDVLESPKAETVCVYDIKTGRSRLYPGRTAEIAANVYSRFPNARRIIVIETRPHH
jgi:hypothetical protein